MLFPSSQTACLPRLPPLVLIICSLPACAVLTFWGRAARQFRTRHRSQGSSTCLGLSLYCPTVNNNTYRNQSVLRIDCRTYSLTTFPLVTKPTRRG